VFVLGNFFIAIAKVLDVVIQVYIWVIVIHALLSWVNPDPFNPIVRLLNSMVFPIYYPIRRFLPTVFGMVDFTPFIAVLLLLFLKYFLVASFFRLGIHLGGGF